MTFEQPGQPTANMATPQEPAAPADPVVTGTPAEAAKAILTGAEGSPTAPERDPVTGQFVAKQTEAEPATETAPVTEIPAEPASPPEAAQTIEVDGIGAVPLDRAKQIIGIAMRQEWDLADRKAAFAQEQAEHAGKVAEANAAMERASAMLAMAAQDPEGFLRLAQSPAIQGQIRAAQMQPQPSDDPKQRPMTVAEFEQRLAAEREAQQQTIAEAQYDRQLADAVREVFVEGSLGALTAQVRATAAHELKVAMKEGTLTTSTPIERVKGFLAQRFKQWSDALGTERNKLQVAKDQRAAAAAAIQPSPALAVTPAPTPPKETRPLHLIPAKEFGEKYIRPILSAREPEV